MLQDIRSVLIDKFCIISPLTFGLLLINKTYLHALKDIKIRPIYFYDYY